MKVDARVTPRVLGELLVSRGLISQEQLRGALSELVHYAEQKNQKKHLGQILIAKQLITYDQLDALLAEQEWIEAELKRLGSLKLPVHIERPRR
jgi:hypothetical protein